MTSVIEKPIQKVIKEGIVMKYKIVSDSSCNLFSMEGQSFASVPMKILADNEYVDREGVDLPGMIQELKHHKGKSGSSCPNVGEWMDAFEDAEVVFGLTISKNLSGSYNSACNAAQAYMAEHPGRRVHILDSIAAGPAMAMFIKKLQQLITDGLDDSAILEKFREYQNHVHTLFCLESLTNLARNGRTSPAIAKLAGVLGIRVCGEAQNGKIALVAKPRGPRKAVEEMARLIQERGFHDGATLRIAHCFNPDSAKALRDLLQVRFPNARYIIETTTALCSYYAEYGGFIVGFEGAFNALNNNLAEA